MPYIQQSERNELDQKTRGPVSAGELAYCIAKMVKRWVGTTPDYATLAQVVGVLDTAKAEFMRQVVEPYEDKKRGANGSVY